MRTVARVVGSMVVTAILVATLALPAGAADDARARSPAALASEPLLPEAALRPEPSLPAPATWPFGEDFPRTSGTSRYADGAFYFSDFLYDDHGAMTGIPRNESAGAVSFGSYVYPSDDRYAGNAADVFRTAVGLTDDDTWWRIDWNTLVEADVPIAAFGLDLDGDQTTGVAAFPAGAGVSAAGLDAALVVSGTGAWLHDLAAGDVTPVDDLGGTVTVDLDARSFLVRVPRSALTVSGTSTAWLVAGLANDTGDGFLTLTPEHGATGFGANVYNAAFRDYDDEPASNNFWFDMTQAQQLALGDVTPFSVEIDWDRLASGASDPQPRPTGYSNRWYVSSVELGQGVITGEQSTADDLPNYLGRVQPYAVYVPTAYDPATPTPLTWILHSFTINHNQYGATAPTLIAEACEDRGAICATTLQRGPDGGYVGVHELDFWEVWRALDETYAIDADRVTVGGYSMGGFGTVRFALNHPDLFAGAFLMASAATDDLDRLENARWTPWYHVHGALDELVPIQEAFDEIEELDGFGYRYRFDVHPTEDHVAYSLKDGFHQTAVWLGEQDRTRVTAPPRITYRWYPADVDDDLGIGPDGAWWLNSVMARDAEAPVARVDAISFAIPNPEITVERSQAMLPDAQPSPARREELDWVLGEASPTQPRMTLDLDNVGAVTVDLAAARLDPGPDASIEVDTEGSATVTLAGVPDGTAVTLDGARLTAASADGTADVQVPSGVHTIAFGIGEPDEATPPETEPLPTTGRGLVVPALLVLLIPLLVRPRIRRNVS